MNTIKISVIVPVYNSEKYLEECLNSLINQTLEDIEIICVDDGSTDSSPKILKKYSIMDNRIKILTQKNKDVGAARETGLKNATGNYIAFCDNDDWLDLNALEELYTHAKANNSDVVIFKAVFYYESDKSYVYPSNFNLRQYFKENTDFDKFIFKAADVKEQVMNKLFAPWFKIYKSEFLNKYSFYFKENITYPDVPFHVQIMLRADKISFCDKSLYFYRREHPESMFIISQKNERIFDIFVVVDEVETFLAENKWMDEYRVEFILFKIEQLSHWLKKAHISIKKEFFKKVKEEILKLKISEKEFNNLPIRYLKLYEDIINSNSLEKWETLNQKPLNKYKSKKIANYHEKPKNNRKFPNKNRHMIKKDLINDLNVKKRAKKVFNYLKRKIN
jgi:glycosyltransferase involved in cell wall biosynthesis